MDLTIVGAGVVGLWTAAQAIQRGFKVKLFERFNIGHDRGSSHGDTRIFRSAYWEGKEYVNFAKQSQENCHVVFNVKEVQSTIRLFVIKASCFNKIVSRNIFRHIERIMQNVRFILP